jgi:RNA polymerase sigma factor (sigma-70 family)
MNLNTATDEALIEALRQKNLDALEELYDRHHRMAMAIVYRVLSDRGMAEDVIQEAFLAVWRQSETYAASRGSVRSWLLSIVRHRAIDLTRGSAFSREKVSLDQVVLEPRYPDTWQEVSARLDSQQIRKAMDELPQEQREVIMLAYFNGYNQREIAERIGVPLGTVKGRIRLGMQKLRGMLKDTGVGERY